MGKLSAWYFPFVLAALIMCGTSLFPLLFNGTSRWLYVLLSFLLAFFSPYSVSARRTPLFRLISIYLLWCLMTVIWSEILELSIYKVMAATLIAVGLFLLGYTWMLKRRNAANALMALYWITPAALIIAISGKSGGGFMSTTYSYYPGLAGNSNFLGWMMAISIPLLLWKSYDQSITANKRKLFLLMLGVVIYYLLVSQSRASMLMALFIFFGFFISSSMSNRFKMIGLGSIIFVSAVLFIPNLNSFLYSKFILKGSSNLAMSYELSRSGAFATSYDKAMEGGFIGGGYGVSIGENPHLYNGGLTTGEYGREKGSSILAIIEETGWVGAALVLLLLWKLFSTALQAYRFTGNREHRALVGMFSGLLLGMVVHTNFEAWWVAPGSAESMFFWGITGMSYAFFLRVISESSRGQMR